MTDYKTDYSQNKNINTMDKGSYNDWGDLTPAKQVLARQPDGDSYDVCIIPKGENKLVFNDVAAVAIGASQLLTSYTVPAGSEALLKKIYASGDNIGQFQILKNGAQIIDVNVDDCAAK